MKRLVESDIKQSDIEILKQAISSGQLVLASGGSVAILGDVTESIILTMPPEALGFLQSLQTSAPFFVDQYLSELEHLYSESRIEEWYEPLEGFLEIREGQFKRVDVDQYVGSWLDDQSKRHLAILGDYGTGKSWFCLRLAKNLVDRYRMEPDSRPLPLLLSFKRYKPNMNLEELIKLELLEGYGVELRNPAELRRCLRSGTMFPILDGLDEMAKELGERTALVAYSRLGIASEIPKVIITCRNHYFYTGSEEREIISQNDRGILRLKNVPNFETLHLKLLDRPKILKCVKRRFNASTASEVMDFVDSTYNLPELCSRPILLSLVCESYEMLPKLDNAASSADLYEAYLDAWLHREYQGGRLIVDPGDVMSFFEDLAEYMVRKDTLILEANKLQQCLSALLEKKIGLSPIRLKDVERQLITSTFVKRSASDGWLFAHRSFMEFFYARKFFRWESDTEGDGVFAVVHTPIWQFIAHMALKRWDEEKALFWIQPRIRRENDESLTMTTLRAAAAYWLLKKGQKPPQEYPLSGIMLDSVDLMGLDLNKCDLSNADFHSSNLAGSNLSFAEFSGSDLRGTMFSGCNISFADFRGANFGHLSSNSWLDSVKQLKNCLGSETALFDKDRNL
jgi:hypothetical protein